MARILVADDHDALRRGLALSLTSAGHDVDEAANGNAALERLHDGYFDVVVSDLKMGGSDGLDVLRTTKTLHPTASVILMTAFGSVTTAVEAMKHGAFDYVQKPFELEEMEVKVEKALELKRLRNELDYLRNERHENYDFDRIVGASEALARVLGVAPREPGADAPRASGTLASHYAPHTRARMRANGGNVLTSGLRRFRVREPAHLFPAFTSAFGDWPWEIVSSDSSATVSDSHGIPSIHSLTM